MKIRFIVFTFIAFVSLGSATVFAQNAVDSLFFRDGRVEGVIVSRSTSDMIQFSYPNETLQNEMWKSELLRIKYASGRIEQLSVIEDALPVPEPEFVGEAYLIGENNNYSLLDKEVAQTKYGLRNKYKIKGREANLQIDNTGTMSFVVRANDNESVPMSIITIYKLTRSGTKRKVVVDQHGAGLSETVKKFEMPFTAEKYGKSSYLVVAKNYKSGEYAITVYNPNTVDEKKIIFNCIGVLSSPD